MRELELTVSIDHIPAEGVREAIAAVYLHHGGRALQLIVTDPRVVERLREIVQPTGEEGDTQHLHPAARSATGRAAIAEPVYIICQRRDDGTCDCHEDGESCAFADDPWTLHSEAQATLRADRESA